VPLTADHAVRLICRARPGGRIEDILKSLERGGWRIEGAKISKGELEAEVTSRSLAGDEIMISPRFDDPESLEELVGAAMTGCWYIDVFHHLRGEAARSTAERLGIALDSRGSVRRREAGVALRVEVLPAASALVISYRLGWGDVGRNLIGKVYERILGHKSGSRLLARLLGWRR